MPRRGNRSEVHGVTVRSDYERAVLTDLVQRGIEPHYEEARLTYQIPRVTVVDFAPRGRDGRPVLIEAKGYMPPSDRTKIVEVVRANPDVDYRLLFQRAGTKLRKGSRTTYGAWADRHAIEWAEGLVPEDWLG